MKHLHIMTNDKFTDPYIKFIEKNFDMKEHYFIIIGNSNRSDDEINKRSTIRRANVFRMNKKFSHLIKLEAAMYEAQKIYLHGLFNKYIVFILFLQPWLLKKCYWVIWGGDLYYYKFRKKHFKNNLYEYIRRLVIKKMGSIISLTPGDYELAKKWYKTQAKQYLGIYINPIKKEFLDKIEVKEKDDIYIQIGNSANPSNNHLEILDILEKFKNEKIKIFAPLSYGDQQYALKVKRYGEERFGDKFIAMLEFLSPKKYSEYLGSIDILVLNQKRQQGLFNIYSLAYLGKKIYLRNDITSWYYLKEDLGLKIYNTLNIGKESFNEFIQFTNPENNRKIAKRLFQERYIKKIWLNIFEESRERDENLDRH